MILVTAVSILPLAAQNDYVIVVHKNVQETSVKRANVEKIFLGKKSRWSDGTKIVPVNLKQGKTYDAFIEQVIQKSTNAYMNYWRKMIFTGKGVMPVSFPEEADVLEYIGRTEGAIGYVSSSAISATHENVKVISLTP